MSTASVKLQCDEFLQKNWTWNHSKTVDDSVSHLRINKPETNDAKIFCADTQPQTLFFSDDRLFLLQLGLNPQENIVYATSIVDIAKDKKTIGGFQNVRQNKYSRNSAIKLIATISTMI